MWKEISRPKSGNQTKTIKRYLFNFHPERTFAPDTGDRSMAEEDEEKSAENIPKKSKRDEERGVLLHRFRPMGHKRQRIVLIVLIAVFAWMIADFTRIILKYAKEDVKFPLLLTFYIITFFITYIYYLIVFDNIAIYERGISPPLSKEKRLWRTIPRFRTFIPFNEISDFEIIDRPEPFTGLIFKALSRNWILSSNWDIFTLVMVVEQGMANRYILTFELEEIVRVPEEVVEVDVGTPMVQEAQAPQDQPSIKQDTL